MMHQSLQGATFHVEHILPKSRGGKSVLGNLALACPSCNLHKSDRIEACDPKTSSVVPVFHPRDQCWADHFEVDGQTIVGKSAIGRATTELLRFN
jgi:hypothetical protein